MAYKIQKQSAVTETLELYDEQGNLAMTIEVALDRSGLAEKLSNKHLTLVQAQRSLMRLQNEKDSGTLDYDKVIEDIGQAVIDMFEAVFGKKDSDRIREFYGGNVVQMCGDVLPFIVDVVLPKVRKIGKQKRRTRITGYVKKRYF